MSFQNTNYVETVPTGTPAAGQDQLATDYKRVLAFTLCCAAPTVTFTAAANRTINAHRLKLYARQLHPERTVADLIKRDDGWVVNEAAEGVMTEPG